MENQDVYANLLYAIIAIYMGFVFSKSLRKNREEAERRTEEKIRSEIVINVDVEKHGEIFYLFDQKTGEFIAQGKDMQELKIRCDERYKTKIVVANTTTLERHGLV